MLNSLTKFIDECFEVGMLWSEPEPSLPNNYSTTLCQFNSLAWGFQNDQDLESLHQQWIETDVKKEIVFILDKWTVPSEKNGFGNTIHC